MFSKLCGKLRINHNFSVPMTLYQMKFLREKIRAKLIYLKSYYVIVNYLHNFRL